MKTKITGFVLLSLLFACAPKSQVEEQKAAPQPKTFSIEKAVVYRTAKSTGEKLAQAETLTFTEFGQPTERQPCVFIDPLNTFQEMVGIGGALTDASAEVFAKLPDAKKQELIAAYYDQDKGIGYNFSRTNIASCDFSSGSYDYVAENDSTLSTFSIDHDKQYKIPLIKEVFKASGENMKLFVSPWSPPAWMNDNNDRLHGGKLLEKYKQAWANHYIKFIQAYEAEGIPVWGLSVQNEPMAVQKWESCVYTATEERDFVKQYLGPTLQNSGMSDKKLIVWDHNRDLIYQRASTIFNDPEAAKYIWGIGFHWYETWTGSDMQFQNLKAVHETFPDKNLVFTEGCAESFATDAIYEWRLGERYGYSMLNDFNNGTVAWTDWNILLDEQGGPNHVQNFCFAPVHANIATGELIYTNSYYYIGHFSKFIQPGAKRISSSSSRDVLQTTAFLNPDGKIVVVILNTTDTDMDFKLWCQEKAADMKSLGHSIVTVIFE